MDKTKEKSNKKLLIIIIAILVIAAPAVGGVVVYNSFFAEKPTPSNGVVGKITDGWDTGLEDETAPKGSGIQIPGYGTAVMNAEDESLSLNKGDMAFIDAGSGKVNISGEGEFIFARV